MKVFEENIPGFFSTEWTSMATNFPNVMTQYVAHLRDGKRRAFVVKKYKIYFFLCGNDQLFLLDKTLISRLGSCRDFGAALRRTFEPSLNIGIVGCH